MNEQTQALAFFAGANSIFYGERLLTTPNPDADADRTLFARLGIQPEAGPVAQQADVPLYQNQGYQNQALGGLWYDAAARTG